MIKKMGFKKIWKNRDKILEGLTNTICKEDFIEDVAKERLAICNICEHISASKCVVIGTNPCCGVCGCSLKLKVRSLSSSCGLEEINEPPKWGPVLTEEQESEHDLYYKTDE